MSTNDICERIRTICNAVGCGFPGDDKKRNAALSIIERTINSMSDYIGKVTGMEVGVQVARFRLEGQALRDRIMELDRSRRIAHDAMLASVASLNRICAMVDCPAFYDGDVSDRYAVGDFAMEVTHALFANRDQMDSHMDIDEIRKAVAAENQ